VLLPYHGNLALHHPIQRTIFCMKTSILVSCMKNQDLATMSVDQLWALHEKLCSILSTKMDAEKQELERRLARLQGPIENSPNARRSYPKVHPKYRNPERPSETWSGRGKQPHWVGAQLKVGKENQRTGDRAYALS
jgi:DNA-binding protein H-NS